MKRMSLFLSTFLVLSLAACSTSSNDSSNSSNSSDNSEPGGGGGGGGGGTPLKPGDADYVVSFGDDTKKFNVILEDFRPANLSDPYYGGTFTNKLARPTGEVSNLEDLSYVMDYCAYYKEPSFTVTFGYSYSGSLVEEVNKAWWNSTICPGVVGFELSGATGSSVTINFKYNDIAASYVPREVEERDIIPYVYRTNGTKTAFTTVPYIPTEGDLDVYNSDQLLYAVTHGYNPVFATGAKVQAVYDRAAEIVTTTMYEEMTPQEACEALTWRLVSLSSYDYVSDDWAAYVNKDNAGSFPDEACSTFTAGYAEGPLLYGTGFCHGLAKASAIVLALAGLEVRKVSSSSVEELKTTINGHGPEGYWSHGYNYVLDPDTNKYVINDPTYMFSGYVSTEHPGRLLRMNGGFVSVEEWDSVYKASAGMYDDIYRASIESDIRAWDASMEWNNIFYLNDARSLRAEATNCSYNPALLGYKDNIVEYKAQYGIANFAWYHISILPTDLSPDSESPYSAQHYFDAIGQAFAYFEPCYTWGYRSYSGASFYGATIYAQS